MILSPRLRHAGINYFFFFFAFFLVVFFLAFFFELQPQVLHIFVSPTLGSLNQNPLTNQINISVIFIGWEEESQL